MEKEKKVIDTHGHRLVDAECFIIDEILECKYLNISTLEIIHGFNNGTSIRDLIRFEISRSYSHYFKKQNINIRIKPLEGGRTQIIIE